MYNISWNEFETLAIELAESIIKSEKKYTTVICVSRGGLLLGRLLSEILELPLGVISAKHDADKYGNYYVDPHISFLYDFTDDILLVDDVFEDTANVIKEVIHKNRPAVKHIALACIFYRPTKGFVPDYFINILHDQLTINFPYQKPIREHTQDDI
ncbi:MAG: phosphoribosyltransferase family protein [archaeon]